MFFGALLVVPAAHAQVIEEGGFPIKGEGISGESFSLSCPPRLVAQAGESIPLSCAAAGVSEEGVRYEWESLSGEGLDFLSASDELSPLFTAPVSGAGEEYAYRLTTVGATLYETATVIVTVEGVSSGSVRDRDKPPGLQEECYPLTVPDDIGAGCVPWEREPDPFGFGPESGGEFIFPEVSDLPDRGGGFDRQTPPRLECPVAVFLEELETGQVECHAWDASGEEYLEYSWEPVGSTTRDYLDNPRLIPENSPTPSVIAPETPAYETLESFRSGETTFRYRYRLTAISRATGLSSSEEVEVYVSSRRPSVYCPLEIVVEEGETVALDCEGVDPLSFRMDYDEEGASVLWEWEGLWGTSTAPLDATDRASALFTAPLGSAGEEYHYIASMTTLASGAPRTARRRVTVTVTGADEATQAAADASALEYKGSAPAITCNDAEIYEATADFALDCSATDAPPGATYAWTTRGSTANTDDLSSTTVLKPTFSVPDDIDEPNGADKDYEYTVTMTAGGIEQASGDITVTVLEKPNIGCTLWNSPSTFNSLDGSLSPGGTWRFDTCPGEFKYNGAPDDAEYVFTWSGVSTACCTPEIALAHLSRTDIKDPVFTAPTASPYDDPLFFTYTLTVSAENADPVTISPIGASVRTQQKPQLRITCSDDSPEVAAGDADLQLECEAAGRWRDSFAYTWQWSPTGNLTGSDTGTPTFGVPTPEEVDSDTTYTYTVSVSAQNHLSATETVEVTVKNKPQIVLNCGSGAGKSVETGGWEGRIRPLALNCPVVAPLGDSFQYTYLWTARGDTPDTAQLSDKDIHNPEFSFLADVPRDSVFSYTITASEDNDNAEDGSLDVDITVVDTDSSNPSLTCTNSEVYEGAADFTLDCSVTNEPSDATYSWAVRGSTSDTDDLSNTDSLKATFSVPADIDEPNGADKIYEYTVTLSSGGADVASADVTVTVLEKPDIKGCNDDVDVSMSVDEGSGAVPLLICMTRTGAPAGSVYTSTWSTRDGTLPPALSLLNTENPQPLFLVPDDVPSDTTYKYLLTISADNADDLTERYSVTVRDKGSTDPSLTCTNSEVYEGAADFTLDCLVTNEPSDATYAWAARGSTSDTDDLTDTDSLKATFSVPADIDEPNGADKIYEYTVTLSSGGADVASANVTVTVLEKPDIVVECAGDLYKANAGDSDITLECSAAGAPGVDPQYTYAWTARGDTPNTRPLSAINIADPTFTVPTRDNVSSDKTYEYTLAVSAANANSGSFDVTVIVYHIRGSLDIRCRSNDVPYQQGSFGTYAMFYTYEGADDFEIICYNNLSEFGVAPVGALVWEWSAVRTFGTGTSLLSATDKDRLIFDVPDRINSASVQYEYQVEADGFGVAHDYDPVFIVVQKAPDISVACDDSPYEVDEGDDIELECAASGAPGIDPQYTWSWSPTTNLTDHDTATPTFAAPDVSQDTTWTYTVTATADNAKDGTAEVTVTVKALPPVLTCLDSQAYEATAAFTLDCSVTNEPPGATYAWTARGSTSGTDDLSSTTVLKPTFYVPGDIDEPGGADKAYEYTVTLSAGGADVVSEDITVTVLEKPDIVPCSDFIDGRHVTEIVYEGDVDFQFPPCHWAGAPDPNAVYRFGWTTRGGTPSAALSLLSRTDIYNPFFLVPAEVSEDEQYEYTLTVSADNADPFSMFYTMTVLNKLPLTLVCTPPAPVYEGAEDFDLECEASGEPPGSTIQYAWTPRGSTANTDELSDPMIAKPTFEAPENVDADTDYEYTLTVTAENAEDATHDVIVTVLDKKPLDVACATPAPVFEGAANFDLECAATGAPAGSEYAYAWTGWGSTANTDLLVSGADGPTPTFGVPEEVDDDETYEYLLTVSAENAEDATEEVTVRVLKIGSTALVCASTPLVYEGSEDFPLDCSVSGDAEDADYMYKWTDKGATQNTLLLSATDILSPTFYVPDALDETTTYEYLLTARAANVEDATQDVTVTVLNRGTLAVACAPPPLAYEGSPDFALDCSASGAPAGSDYDYHWTATGATANTDLLVVGTDGLTPTFDVPEEVEETTTYEYLLTVSAENAEPGSEEVTVTVLNAGALSVVCTDPAAYEGSPDFALDCSASGAPAGSGYDYYWTPRGNTPNIDRLSDTTVLTPTFDVPEEVEETTTYEYLLTVSAENAEDGSEEVTVTVLNKGTLAVVCADPVSAYEGAADIAFDCSASGAPAGSDYAYAWTARGNTLDTSLLSATDVVSPTFYVPDQVDSDETYTYRLTVSTSAGNINPGTFDLTVNVYDSADLEVGCTDRAVYEGAPPFRLECTASGGPPGVLREWDWSPDTHLTGPRIRMPVFTVPASVEGDMTFTYTATVTAGSVVATDELTVTVLNKPDILLACADPGSVYEGADDITFDCEASGAPGDNPQYTYVWTARGDTQDTSLLSETDIAAPAFYVPDAIDVTTTYEYLLTASAANAEDATEEVTVTVLNRAPLAFVDDSISGRVYVFTAGEVIEDILLPEAEGGLPPYAYTLAPALPPGLDLDDPTRTISGTPLEVSPGTEYTWQAADADNETVQIAFSIEVVPAQEPISPPVAESSPEAGEPSLPEPSSLGVTASASPLRFGVQSAFTEVLLDPMTDGISTYVSGPYHAGRMTLSPDGSEALDENGEMDLSIELVSPVVLKRADAIEASSIVLTPSWFFAESCGQLSSQAIGGLYTEMTLSEDACRLLRFGGELDLTDMPSGHYSGNMDIILRSGENEETHSVEVSVTVVPAQQVITIGPGGVRFSTSRELPAGLTEEQNLSIYPHVAFLTGEKPHGVFELSNPSLIPLEVSVSARFGYTEATEQGREVVVEDVSASRLSDLSEVVDIYPGVLVLQPGEKGLVRYGVKEEAHRTMTEQGYAAFFDVVSQPRRYADLDRMPEEVTGEKTALVTMRVPGVYVPGEGTSQLRATLSSISFVGPMSATFLLETQDYPFVGEVVAYDGNGRELGRTETLVYTRSRVRIPLNRMPGEGAVFLRFSPRGSGRVPEPASVEWNAPPGYIGAAGDKDRTSPSAPLVRKP